MSIYVINSFMSNCVNLHLANSDCVVYFNTSDFHIYSLYGRFVQIKGSRFDQVRSENKVSDFRLLMKDWFTFVLFNKAYVAFFIKKSQTIRRFCLFYDLGNKLQVKHKGCNHAKLIPSYVLGNSSFRIINI